MEFSAETLSSIVLFGLIALALLYRAIFGPGKGSSSFDADGGDGGDGGD
ncbi:hypothetical protein NOJ28_16990 [Neorhizobium galegae]|nr:hypothetical protein [Neorhizobium galegae]CDZ26190.1 Hypothetical protein NGAL_HAMBI490_10250 [Neorhizobium galegae bv. officinalis]CDZ57917.1 Hypothetical protein NGAL_HAMBI2566_24730 [Neorhizobium galegae bv. orientalis]MCQ1767236.1 hypothetical protein [Neorhizobium galegae]MCQ1846820.1 hypothetical protein [Neorhizobium galegae]CDZ42078.1 Hypothetical protein NGAL_HAMBI1146_48440 [Neorhizobium galegae bv. officinalis]